MARYKLIGRATINGACYEKFEVVVESYDTNFTPNSKKMADAVQALHPDWKSINVETWKQLS